MRVRCIDDKVALLPDERGEFRFTAVAESSPDLILGKEYEVLEEVRGMYRIEDESGDAFFYPRDIFEIVETDPKAK